jgi:hypothetical protein
VCECVCLCILSVCLSVSLSWVKDGQWRTTTKFGTHLGRRRTTGHHKRRNPADDKIGGSSNSRSSGGFITAGQHVLGGPPSRLSGVRPPTVGHCGSRACSRPANYDGQEVAAASRNLDGGAEGRIFLLTPSAPKWASGWMAGKLRSDCGEIAEYWLK